MAHIDPKHIAAKVQTELLLTISTVKEKGLERFGRVLIVAVAVPFLVHRFVYAPATQRLAGLDAAILNARVAAEHAEDYKQRQELLALIYAELPQAADRENWLSQTVRSALRSEGLFTPQLAPPVEEESNGLILQNLSINVSAAQFPDIMAFLSRMETTKPMILITNLSLTKVPDKIGRIDFSCTLSTIIVMERY